MPSISPQVTPYYGGGQVKNPADVLQKAGTPSSADMQHNVGTLFVDTSAQKIYALTGKSGGTANWSELGGGTDTYPITPYVVGPVGDAGYQTIQSAIDAANAAGGGTVYIQPGTYTENLTLYAFVNLIGYSGENGDTGIYSTSQMAPAVEIAGTITIDTSLLQVSTFNTFTNILISPPTGNLITFFTNQAESSAITFIGCTINVNQNGSFVFVVDGFPVINLQNCTIVESTSGFGNLLSMPNNDKFCIIQAISTFFTVNNLSPCVLDAGCDVHFYLTNCNYSSMIDSSSLGSFFSLDAISSVFAWEGSANEPLVNFGSRNGHVSIQNSVFLEGSGPFSSSTAAPAGDNYYQITNTHFTNTIKLNANSQDSFLGCTFFTPSVTAIEMNSASDIVFSNCVINSSVNPCITGTGAGLLTLANITFLDDSNIAATLSLGNSDVTISNSFSTNNAADNLTAFGNTISSGGSNTNVDINLTPKGTGGIIQSRGVVGADATIEVTNTDNTNGASRAGVEIATGGAASGDPYLSFQISGVGASTMTMGLDNSASDLFVISNSTAIGTSNSLTLSQAGALTASTSITATVGNITATNGNVVMGTAGNKIIVPTGANASAGTSGVMSGTPGAVTVATTASSATAKIFYCRATTGGTPGNVSITAQDGTGFTLTSTGNETSTFNWWIINA